MFSLFDVVIFWFNGINYKQNIQGMASSEQYLK